MAKKITRRQFLKTSSLAGAAMLITGCHPAINSLAGQIENTLIPTPGSLPVPLTPTTGVPTSAPTPAYQASVAISRVSAYDQALIKKSLESMFSSLGGIQDLIKPGVKVGIKVNLTGGTWWDTPDKPSATEYFVTHPAVVAALAEILFDLGAAQITVMDGLGDETIFTRWGYKELSSKTGVTLLDLCKPTPYSSFALFPIGDNYLIYPEFSLHPALAEQDVFISLAKLKCHATTGITLSLKNLIGLAPISLYRNRESDNNRSAFHGNSAFDTRLPRVIIDLNKARPIHLAIIDGISTAEGGAGPWDVNLSQVKPGLLLAGKNALAVDTVSTAVMGFNPQAESGESPYIGGENHLALASEAGLGCFDLKQIQVLGASIEEVLFPFKPAR